MPRTVAEWIGKTDDAPFPPRVRLRILERFDRRCAGCGKPIRPGERWTCDHIIALINGGENRESNGQPLCRNCTKPKDAADVAVKSKTADMAKAAYGIKARKGPPMPGSRASPWKRKIGGPTIRRHAS